MGSEILFFFFFLSFLVGPQFLERLADVLEEYLGAPLNEDFVKGHFVVVHEVLEEMMDGGFPLVTEPNALKV